jgi:hypothetical protein
LGKMLTGDELNFFITCEARETYGLFHGTNTGKITKKCMWGGKSSSFEQSRHQFVRYSVLFDRYSILFHRYSVVLPNFRTTG